LPLRSPLRSGSAPLGVALSAPGFFSGVFPFTPLPLLPSASFTAAVVLKPLVVGSFNSLAAATTAPLYSASAVTSLPEKSAIARVVPLPGSCRNRSASSEVPNQMAPSSVATIDRMRLSWVSKAILAVPLFGSIRNSFPSGPVPA